MNTSIWLLFVILTTVFWVATCLLYKTGARGREEKHICLKFSVCIGFVFFVIALVYLLVRDEPFTIWESAVRHWPMTAFGIVYAVINTISFNGFVYNEATVESPIEGISGGTSTVLLIIAYLVLGRVDSLSELLTPLKVAGIIVIMVNIICLSTVRNRESRENSGSSWRNRGLGTLIFPVLYAVADSLETITTGICLDTTYGYAMPEGDSVIIIGMEYAVFAFGFWIYIWWKEGKPYNPFTKKSAPRLLGAVVDNIGIVCYSYAMAYNSVSTDPLLAVYPILVMLGGHVIMKEKLSVVQYIFLTGIVVGSVMVISDAVIL